MKTKYGNTKIPRRMEAAFTLVELLVTISIVVVLVAISFFGYGKFRASADKVRSISNLNQLQLANAAYASDHSGRYVTGFAGDKDGKLTEQWDRNSEFLSNLRGEAPLSKDGRSDVPVNLLDPVAYRARGKNYNMLRGSYGAPEVYGVSYGAPDADSSLKLAQITSPNLTASFVTALDWHITYGGRLTWNGTEGPVGRGIIAYRHNNKALVVYYDGHIGEVTKEDMKDFDKKGGKENPFWKGNY